LGSQRPKAAGFRVLPLVGAEKFEEDSSVAPRELVYRIPQRWEMHEPNTVVFVGGFQRLTSANAAQRAFERATPLRGGETSPRSICTQGAFA
jgi:hypothetical protein